MTSTPSPAPEGEMKLRASPCPKCGYDVQGGDRTPEDVCWHTSGGGEFIVHCARCGHDGELKARPEWAVDAWNTRPTPIAEGDKELVERCAKIAESHANCGCNGKHGACMVDDTPLAIAKEIRALAADRLEQLSGK